MAGAGFQGSFSPALNWGLAARKPQVHSSQLVSVPGCPIFQLVQEVSGEGRALARGQRGGLAGVWWGEYTPAMGHEIQDRASLEMARRIAAGLPAHPEWIELARANLDRWTRQNAAAPGLVRNYAEWRKLLELPVQDISTILTAETDEGQRLRQNSPFVGVLSPKEVWEIKAWCRSDARTA